VDDSARTLPSSTAAARIAGSRPYRSATRPAPAPAAAPKPHRRNAKPSSPALTAKWAVIAFTAPLVTVLS